jgi:hypothetical protein
MGIVFVYSERLADQTSEFIANGMVDGTGFIEILPEGRMSVLGFL